MSACSLRSSRLEWRRLHFNFVNDLFFVRYQAKLMLLDSLNMPKDVELAHRRLADFIWTMDELPRYDDVTLLVELTRCELKDWARILGGLEQKGWHADGKGYFVHDKILSTLLESKDLYDKKVNQTKAATEARKQRNVKRNVDVTKDVTCHQSQSQSQSHIVHTLSPTSLSLSKPSPPATSVCVSVSKKKQQDDLNGRFQWLAIQLCGMYKREEKRFALGEEEHLALDISRRPSLTKELKEIQAYRHEVGERFFPQSMARLLQQWTDTLDKARNHKPAPQPFKELSIAEKELRQIQV